MTAESPSTSGYDLFLSHSSADKPWVRQLHDVLSRHGMTSFLDEQDIRAPENYVLTLNDALRTSRFLVLVASPRAAISHWVEQEWTAFLAEHGPVGRIVVVLLEAVELPALLKPVQQVDATHRDVERVATELILIAGRAGELKDGDVRALFLGQDLVFVLQQAANQLQVTDPTGQTRTVTPPWRVDNRLTVALLGFSQLTRQAVETDAERAELVGHAWTLGKLLYELLFSSDESRRLLELALLPGQARPLVTIRSDDDVLLSLPWELLHDGQSFLVREARLDMVRSTLGQVGAGGVLREPEGYFKLVVNVSAPEGGTLDYEAESYRITRALSEHCEIHPTELGTLDDLVDMVRRVRPVGVHFSGHGLPGKLQFENDEGRAHEVAVGEVIVRMRTELPDGGLPKFFFLASCHGNEPAQPEEGQPGSESSAALLHRAGVPQVVGYFGPIADELSTRAEEALYAAIAEGETTRYGVRQARRALAEAFWGTGRQHRPGRDAEISTMSTVGARDGSHPFSWAQLVFYQRGPDHALSLPVSPDARRRREQELRRTFEGTGTRKILSTGFIGRRMELHRIRRRLRRGDRVLVFQGLGGLGKTTLAFRTMPMLGQEEDVCTLWCQEVEREADPAEALVGQLLEYCRRRFGVEWEPVVQQVDRAAGEDPALRFQYFLQELSLKVKPLVVYLDNMESLLIGPQGAGPGIALPGGDGERGSLNDPDGNGDLAFGGGDRRFAAWRSVELQQIWRLLVEMARSGDRTWVVASCRYRNEDFDRDTIPVSPLPADALYRLMGWFPALRRLTGITRARLVERLAGHPRAVEFANDLVGDALSRWEDRHGEWRLPHRAAAGDSDREWKQLVEPALPRVREKLWGGLLLAAIWDRVLDDRARRMLYRMTLLRRPWEWELMTHLGEAEGPGTEAEARAERLRQTSLLEQVELFVRTGGDGYATVRHYTMHPATAQFVVARFGADERLRRETHRRIGEYLEERAAASPYIETDLEAGHHLFEAGEYDRAHQLLGPASDWLQDHGRVREGLRVLEPFLAEAVTSKMAPARAGRLLGTVGLAYARLGQVEKAIGLLEQSLRIGQEIKDPQIEGFASAHLNRLRGRA
jgi:hypothetical protein